MVPPRQLLMLLGVALNTVVAERVAVEFGVLSEDLADTRGNETTETEEGVAEDNEEFAVMDWDEEVEEGVDGEIQELNNGSSLSELGGLVRGGYVYTQLVGLSLYTFPGGMFKSNVKTFYTGVAKLVENHEGAYPYNVDDAIERVKVMEHMMEVAYQSKYYSTSSKVLKIFIAPEFFFRGPYGAYNMNSLEGCTNRNAGSAKICNAPIIKIFQLLDKIVTDDKWADWLFVFGTVVASIGHKQFFNFAPVMRGGSQGKGKHHIVSKTHVSGIDFINCDGKPGQICEINPDKHGIKHYSPFSKKQVQKLNDLGFSVSTRNEFKIDGIHFGVEICLDHAQKSLAANLKGQEVDVHLITSAGMSIGYTAAKAYGPTYLQDGGGSGARTSYFCKGCDYQGRGDTELKGYSPGEVVYSSQDLTYEQHMQRVRSLKWPDPKKWQLSTKRSTEEWYSHRGFATEGTGAGLDRRFEDKVIHKVFATDNYSPTINIGPAFALPSAYGPAPQPAPHPGSGNRHGCQDRSSGVIRDGRIASCYSVSHYCSGTGMVAAAVQANCLKTCGFC